MPSDPWLPPPIAEGVEWQIMVSPMRGVHWRAQIGLWQIDLVVNQGRFSARLYGFDWREVADGSGPTYAAALAALRAELAPLRVLMGET